LSNAVKNTFQQNFVTGFFFFPFHLAFRVYPKPRNLLVYRNCKIFILVQSWIDGTQSRRASQLLCARPNNFRSWDVISTTTIFGLPAFWNI